jgi:hypothetical protein
MAVFKTIGTGSMPVLDVCGCVKGSNDLEKNNTVNSIFHPMRLEVSNSIKQEFSVLKRQTKKKIVKQAKLYLVPEQAKIGPALAQIGIDAMGFCERFNLQTRSLDKEFLVSVKIYVFSDKSFTFTIKPFRLYDLVCSFDLDDRWSSVRSGWVKGGGVGESVFDADFVLAFYKAVTV